MTPSDRIKLIKSIAGRLHTEEWPIIDLTLRQFELPYSDTWNGEKFNYVVSMVERATDGVLLSLYNHLGFDAEKTDTTDITPSFWAEGQFRLFVSHLADHKVEATQLKAELVKYGVSCFVAHRDIEPTKEWIDEIEMGLRTCDALIALMRPGFHASKWTDQEIGYAMGRGLLVFSVRLGEDPYGFLGRFQAIPPVPIPTLAEKAFEVLVGHKKSSRNMSRAVLHRFSTSNTYAEAKENIGLVEKLPYWDHELERRIAEVVETNGQVKDSWGVENRVKAFNQKWKQKTA